MDKDKQPHPSWGRNMPGDLAKRWPKDERGECIAPAFLTSCSQLDMGDTLTVSLLDSCGIPCLRQFPHYGGFGNLMLGMSAEGIDLFVPETMLEEARAMLEGEPVDEEL